MENPKDQTQIADIPPKGLYEVLKFFDGDPIEVVNGLSNFGKVFYFLITFVGLFFAMDVFNNFIENQYMTLLLVSWSLILGIFPAFVLQFDKSIHILNTINPISIGKDLRDLLTVKSISKVAPFLPFALITLIFLTWTVRGTIETTSLQLSNLLSIDTIFFLIYFYLTYELVKYWLSSLLLWGIVLNSTRDAKQALHTIKTKLPNNEGDKG